MFLLILFGITGYFMLRYGYTPAGAAVAAILGNGLETNFRTGLLLCNGSLLTFISRPWTGAVLAFSAVRLIYGAFGTIRLARRAAALRRQSLEEHQAAGAGSTDR